MWLSPLLLLAASCSALQTLEPEPPVATTRVDPVEGWFTARMDHFDASNTDTFQMRYYYSDEFSASDYILIFVGGEWSISAGWLQAGLMHELAQELPAAMFYTEHRYYGQTRPTEDTSVANLRFLSVDQALADLAQFIAHIRSDAFEGGKFSNAKVGLVGCSYAGSMATWMRLAYPHVVDAAFSDSGPLHAQEDFPEYLEVITSALRGQGGDGCVSSVEQAMQGLAALLATANGPATVSQMFNTCTTISTSPLDLATFYWFGITETFAYLVQYATPGQIPAACDVLTNAAVADPVQRLANWITAQPWSQPCIDSSYSQVLAGHTNTSYDADDSVMRLWTYQTCVEYGWYQTTTSANQPFLSAVPLEYFHQMCKDFFSADFDESLLRSGIERTNLMFGGVTFLPDSVVSVAGLADPWSPMGPNSGHATDKAPVYEVPDISHCRAIRPTATAESPELQQTQRNVKSYLSSFLTGQPPALSAAAPLAAAAGLALALAVLLSVF